VWVVAKAFGIADYPNHKAQIIQQKEEPVWCLGQASVLDSSGRDRIYQGSLDENERLGFEQFTGANQWENGS